MGEGGEADLLGDGVGQAARLGVEPADQRQPLDVAPQVDHEKQEGLVRGGAVGVPPVLEVAVDGHLHAAAS